MRLFVGSNETMIDVSDGGIFCPFRMKDLLFHVLLCLLPLLDLFLWACERPITVVPHVLVSALKGESLLHLFLVGAS